MDNSLGVSLERDKDRGHIFLEDIQCSVRTTGTGREAGTADGSLQKEVHLQAHIMPSSHTNASFFKSTESKKDN